MRLFDEKYSNSQESYNQNNTYNALYSTIFSKLERLKQYQTIHLKRSDKLNSFLSFKSLLEIHFNTSRNTGFYAEKLNVFL